MSNLEAQIQSNPYERLKLAAVAAVAVGMMAVQACSGSGESIDDDSRVADATETTTADQEDEQTPTEPTGTMRFPDGVADGRDAAVFADHQNGAFECGPREPGIGEDGSYAPETYKAFMNENIDLANDLDQFNENDMGARAYNFLVRNAAVNGLADDSIVIEGNERYSDLSDRLIATNQVPTQVAVNHDCIGGINRYDYRELVQGETTVMGLTVTPEDYQTWREMVTDAGNDPDEFITFNLDTTVEIDGEMQEQTVVFVTLLNGICKNPLRVPDEPIITTSTTAPPQEAVPTTPVPTRPSTTRPPVITVTTPPPPVPTTKLDNQPTPGQSAQPDNQPAPAGPPDVAPTTSTTRPPTTTETTINATVPTTEPPIVTITQPQG